MEMLEYKKAVKEILGEVIMYEDYDDSQDLIKEGILDSLTIVYLISRLEEEFNIAIDEKLIAPKNFSSINTIADFLDSLEKDGS